MGSIFFAYIFFCLYLTLGFMIYTHFLKLVYADQKRVYYRLMSKLSVVVRIWLFFGFILLWLPLLFIQGILWLLIAMIDHYYSH